MTTFLFYIIGSLATITAAGIIGNIIDLFCWRWF